MDDCRELERELNSVRDRVLVLETLKSEFVTHGQLEKAISGMRESSVEQSGKLDRLCETFDLLKSAHDHALMERAQAEKEEREQRMQMMRTEHEEKMNALQTKAASALLAEQDRSFIAVCKRWAIYLGLLTTVIGILGAVIGGVIWLIQHAAK